MNKINDIMQMGFRITWRVIAIGLFGEAYITPQLSKDDVYEYLDSLLTVPSAETDKIIKLICERDDNIKTDQMITFFAELENADLELQLRKWRAYLLKRILDEGKEDFMRSLLDLTEFWVSLGMPNDSPHEYPTKNNVEKEYFTEETFFKLKSKSENWLLNEIQFINSLEHTT